MVSFENTTEPIKNFGYGDNIEFVPVNQNLVQDVNIGQQPEENTSTVDNEILDTPKKSNKVVNMQSTQQNVESIEDPYEDSQDDSDDSIGNPSEDFELLHKSLACVKCDSGSHGSDCVHGDDMKYLGHCFNELGQCYTQIIDGNVTRGCVGDKLIPDQAYAKRHSNSVILCNHSRFCNKEKILDTCLVCSGAECQLPSLKMERACSLGTESQGCYLKINSTINSYERGCMQNLSQIEREECQEHGSPHCQSCSKRNCNRKVNFKQTCHFCDGSVHKHCHVKEFNGTSVECIGYSSICLTGIDAQGFTHRQCSQNDADDAQRFPNGFETCYPDLCNLNVFPEHRIKCYKCEKGRRCDHPSVELRADICRTHPVDCFIYEDEGKKLFSKKRTNKWSELIHTTF